MKKLLSALLLFPVIYTQAQIGVGTTSPNSTLDVRGSLSTPVTSFSANTTAGSSDNLFLFTGTSPATLTLPTAVGITGREYWIKNISSNSSTLTIATTSAQTIDGLASWSLTLQNKAVRVVSNGTNWYAASESLPGSTGTPWVVGGNNVVSMQNFGTTSNFALPFLTNNTERMRLSATGSLGIGTSTFNGTNTEKLIVDAGSGGTAFQNVIVGKGNTNSYAQLNIQNAYNGALAGTIASADVVATADNGNESVNFIDMGINTSGNNSTGVLGGANTAYLYTTGNDFAIGNGTTAKNLNFFTTAAGVYTERMRIDGAGNVGIGNNTPSEKLDVTGNIEFSGALMPGGSAGTAGNFLMSNGAGTAPTWFDASGLAWETNGNPVPSIKTLGTTTAYALPFITNNTEQMRISASGEVGIGITTFNASNPEQLLVYAASPATITDYQNVIVGKGNTNSYAQLNIQNTYSGASTPNVVSSDVVATANNGNESSNYIDMGINGGSNTSTGVLGGANTAYIYSNGTNLSIGNLANARDILFFTTTSAVTAERMRLTNTGMLQPAANNTYDLGTSTLRWRTIYSNNVLNTSDARLKTNIKDLNYGLSAILNIHPVQYNWKEGNDPDKKIGFLAQELRKVIPEVVIGDENKETLAINYTELIPVLVNAIKEQQRQIDDLKKRIIILERK